MTEPTRMEVGGTGTAKAEFKDAFDKDVKVSRVIWHASLDGVIATPDEKDPLTANLQAVSPGPATITAIGETESGARFTVDTRIIVMAKAVPTSGKITIEAKPAPEKAEPAKADAAPAHAAPAHAATHGKA